MDRAGWLRILHSTFKSFAQVCCDGAMKIVVLVIASDNLPIYAEHHSLWRSYATRHPDITVYFSRQREDVDTPYFDGDTIWTPGKECLERIFDKTIDAFKLIPPSYDFLVRTNLSSVWNFKRLVEFCAALPRENVYCGVLGNPGISGAGMILSPDVIQKFIEKSHTIERGMWDDVDFGRLSVQCGIPSTRGYRYDPRSKQEADQCCFLGYHFYLKDMRTGTRNIENELFIMRHLISKIYGDP